VASRLDWRSTNRRCSLERIDEKLENMKQNIEALRAIASEQIYKISLRIYRNNENNLPVSIHVPRKKKDDFRVEVWRSFSARDINPAFRSPFRCSAIHETTADSAFAPNIAGSFHLNLPVKI